MRLLDTIPQPLWKLLKVFSTVLILGAIALELWHQYANFAHQTISANLTAVFWIERLALVGHLVEAGIAIAAAPARQQNPFTYGMYTFFTGFLGLTELFAQSSQLIHHSLKD